MAQEFRSPIDGKIITIDAHYDMSYELGVLWSHIKQSFGDVRLLRAGSKDIYCMVDHNLETVNPPRIKYLKGVVIDIVLNGEPPLRAQDVKEEEKGEGLSLVKSPLPAYSSEPDDNYIRFGSFICLRHMDTGGFLRAPNLRYNMSGQSDQYVVYGVRSQNPGQEDWWVVVATEDENRDKNEQIQYGSRVRLFNKANSRWLHTHWDIKPPVTPDQQQVTGTGDSASSDCNDVWIIEKAEDGNDYWKSKDIFLLQHESTGKYLHSHGVRFLGEKEVTAYDTRNNIDNLWRVRRG
ncbi:hypothetical protein BGX26_000370 [Mortierella sp. AD094]|nr:hypothetical protein BGX26_000370 [Mortierella sp. AD094]